MIKKIFIWGLGGLLFIALISIGIIGIFQITKKKEFNKVQQVISTLDTDINENETSNKFNSKLGSLNETLIFSIPKDAKIPSRCLGCKEKGIDPVEGQYWDFSVSSNYQNYAYPISENDQQRIVFNGEKKKAYDKVYLLKFSPNSKDFTYHAYSKENDTTYLVYNEKEIITYPGHEGWPQAADGFLEAFSKGGNHFAYSKTTKDNKTHIILDEKIINSLQEEETLLSLSFNNEGKIEYITNSRNKTSSPFNYNYYKEDKFIKYLTYEQFQEKAKKISKNKTSETITLDNKNKSVLVNGTEFADYKNYTPEVYLSELTQDASKRNFAYKIGTNLSKNKVWVSLNGNDSNFKYNDIKNIHFSEDGKKLIYIGRKGRDVYKVTHEILP